MFWRRVPKVLYDKSWSVFFYGFKGDHFYIFLLYRDFLNLVIIGIHGPEGIGVVASTANIYSWVGEA